VKVKQVGGNLSSIDGKTIGKDNEMTMASGSTLFVLSGQFPHRISFRSDSNAKDADVASPNVNTNKLKDKDSQKKQPEKDKTDNKKNYHDKTVDNGYDKNEGNKKTPNKRLHDDSDSSVREPDKKKQKIDKESSHSSKKQQRI
jgi:hypothetical protein